jgi:hypothetical protein
MRSTERGVREDPKAASSMDIQETEGRNLIL